MSSSGQTFASTPTFEVFRRGLAVSAISKFHGINSYSSITQLGPDWAQDLMNVIVSGSGGLSKFRLPVKLSVAIAGQNQGPQSFWDFQQGSGLRQIIANFGASLYYYSNDLAAFTLIETNGLNAPPWSFHEANNILFGVNGQRAMKWTGTAWQKWGIDAPLVAPGAPIVIAGNLSPVLGGYGYSYSYKNSVTGHVGNRTGVSTLTGNQTNKKFQVLAIAPTDPQDDTIVWFRNLDGGGDQFRLAEVNINTGVVTTFVSGADVTVTAATANLGITDNTPDGSLDQQTRGPLINNPPLIGKYVAVGQGRVFVFNLIGFPQDIIYSGYEQILLGRPEESFPQFNRLRLSIGAEQIAGGGVLQSGIVAFSQTGRMYMLRGAVEDITLNAPVNFSAFLEELPWTLGCASHFTIKATPYGLIWHAGDKTVQMFNGRDEPTDISPGIYPYLRRITPGMEAQGVAGYFNWLERDWYALLAAVDGSLTINRLFLFAFNKTPGTNDLQSVEAFVSDLPATFPGSITWIDVITTSKLQRKLCVGGQGFIYELPVSSDTVNGITQDRTLIPATTGKLSAFWRGGYFGNESPARSKLFRWSRLIADQGGFQLTFRMVNDEQNTFQNPEILGPVKVVQTRVGINRRAKRAAPEINFPADDAPANVLELQMAYLGTSDR